ncbi:GntR family transcriptional regulator [Anoxybacterium hadale]|uniref:GntR family transcriptional regulator n=1 Tax=Anoxybacterium hadale TaxID=3408580 RepID=UPI003AFF7BB1
MNTSAVTLYQQIREGTYGEGDALPDVETLAKEYAETLKIGIGDLIYEGALERDPAQPEVVKVKASYLWDVVGGNHSFTAEAKKRGQKPGNKIIGFQKRKVWPQVQRRLELEPDDEVFVMERIVYADKTPVGMEFSYLPAKLYEGLTRDLFEGGKSTFKIMDEKYGHKAARATDELRAARLEEREAEILGLEPGIPVLIRFRVARTAEGVPIKGSRAIYLFNAQYELPI